MFGIGAFELVVILIVALIAVGPEKMPGFVKTLGKGIKEVRRTTRELRSSVGLDEVLRDEDLRDPLGLKKPVAATSASRRPLTFGESDRERERPERGVDLELIASRAASTEEAP